MNRNFFILEGLDGTGKSTLARHMAKQLGGAYFHCTCTQWLIRGIYDYLENVTTNMMITAQNGVPVIMDRSWISEYAYALAIGRGMDMARIMRMHNTIAMHPMIDPIVIHCTNYNVGTVVGQFHGYRRDTVIKIAEHFKDAFDIFNSPDCPVIEYNYAINGDDLESFTRFAQTYEH